jgi:hypothetical protein
LSRLGRASTAAPAPVDAPGIGLLWPQWLQTSIPDPGSNPIDAPQASQGQLWGARDMGNGSIRGHGGSCGQYAVQRPGVQPQNPFQTLPRALP